MQILNLYKEAFLHLPESVSAAEVVAETEAQLTVLLQNGIHNGSSSSDVTSLFVRTQSEKCGFAYTQNLEEDPESVLARAWEGSLYSQSEGLPITAADKNTFTEKEPECELTDLSLLWNRAEEIDRWLTENAPHLSPRKLSVTDRIRTVAVVNSKGRDCQISSHCFCVSLFAADHRYPLSFLSDERTFSSLEELIPDIWKRKLERWYWKAEAQKNIRTEFEPGNYRCILDGSVINNIFITGWRMFTAGNLQKTTSPLAGMMNQIVGSSVLNITDRVVRPESGYSYRADCEGNIGADVCLIKNGMLTGCISSQTDCGDLVIASTGNGGRKDMISGNIHTDVVTMPKNFGVEPGSISLEELIAELSDGIYIYESFDMFHSVNTVSGEYSIPCNGIIIQNGKPAGTVKGLTINGKVQDILREIAEVDSEVQVQPMLMLNSFTVASPDVLIKKLNVSK